MSKASELKKLLTGHDYSRAGTAALRAAADAGMPEAMSELGAYLEDGVRGPGGRVLVRRDRLRAAQYEARLVKLGDRDATRGKADRLTRSPRTRVAGIRLYRRAYRLGSHTAAFHLAIAYRNLGDQRAAVRWFRRAVAAGDPSASMEVARAELYGLGTRRDVPAAFAKLRAIAAAPTIMRPRNIDRIRALLLMADALEWGWLARIDYPASQRLLRRAARLGSTVAKQLLVDM